MADKHVLGCLPRSCLRRLMPEHCKEIVFALNTFGPSEYRTNPLSYNATAMDLVLLRRQEAIDALHKVYEAWGTAAALATAQILECKP